MSERNEEILERLWNICIELTEIDEERLASFLHMKFRGFYGHHVPNTWTIGYDVPKTMTKANIINGLSNLPMECLQHFVKTFLISCADARCCPLMGRIPLLIDLFKCNGLMQLRKKMSQDEIDQYHHVV